MWSLSLFLRAAFKSLLTNTVGAQLDSVHATSSNLRALTNASRSSVNSPQNEPISIARQQCHALVLKIRVDLKAHSMLLLASV